MKGTRPVRLLRPSVAACVALGGLLVPVLGQDDAKVEPGAIQGKLLFQDTKGVVLKKTPRGVVVGDAVFYLVGEGLAPKEDQGSDEVESEAAKAVLDQVDITFVPHVLPVVAGTTVVVRNSDATTHNVHTYPKKNEAMNRTQAPTGTLEVVFSKPEVIHTSCDIHSQMSAYIVVVPNKHFTMSEKDGSFTLTDVPPGEWELVGWHEKYGAVSQMVEVASGNTVEVEVAFKAKARRGRRKGRADQ